MLHAIPKWAALGLAVMAMLPTEAPAQSEGMAGAEPVCWLGDMRFSPGATVRFVDQIKICSDEFTWTSTQETPAGCFHDGEFYSVGALRDASDKREAVTICSPDGYWKAL